MATHSSTLAWKIPWTEEPGGLQSMGSQEVGTQLNTIIISHPCMTTGKIIVMTIRSFVGKVMSLLFNMLSLSQLSFQGTSVLISWLQSPSAVILEPTKIKSVIVSTISPSICHEVMGLDAMTIF